MHNEHDAEHDEPTLLIITRCPVCKKHTDIAASYAGYMAWKAGMLIQDALPDLSKDQREQLITGICNPCWHMVFDRATDA